LKPSIGSLNNLYSFWSLWTTQFAESIENIKAFQPELTFADEADAHSLPEDQRQKIIVQEKYSGLPLPMQNLLEALRTLKLKIQHHKNAFYSNIDLKFFSEALKQSKKVCEIVYLAKAMRSSLIGERLNQIAPDGNFELFESLLVKEVAQLRAKVFDSIDASRAFAQKKVKVNHVVYSTLKEINASEKFRTRLVNLAQGPLSTLFEFSEKEVSKEEEDTIELHADNEDLSKLSNFKNELIKKEEELHLLRFTSDKIFSELASDAKKISSDAVQAIKKIKLNVPVCGYYELPKEAEDADNKLQREIALVLGTLTMDRDALDSSLRSIKLECESLRKSCEDEHVANVYKTLKEIQAMYSSCSQDYLIKT